MILQNLSRGNLLDSINYNEKYINKNKTHLSKLCVDRMCLKLQ